MYRVLTTSPIRIEGILNTEVVLTVVEVLGAERQSGHTHPTHLPVNTTQISLSESGYLLNRFSHTRNYTILAIEDSNIVIEKKKKEVKKKL